MTMAFNKENEIKDLLEDLDLYKFIYDDLVNNQPDDCVAIAEALDKVKSLESKVGELLGQAAPTDGQTTSSTLSPEPPAAPRQGATPASSQTTSSSTQQSRDTLAPSRGEGPSVDPPARTTARLLREDPHADPSSIPYWPSHAPSPFAAPSTGGSRYPQPMPSEQSRKRPRQDSWGALTQPQSSKRTVLSKSMSRMQEIDAEMEQQLAQNREMYHEMKDPDSVRISALAEGITEDQVRRNIDKERDEMEHLIRDQFQLERDGELARMLQAQEESSGEEPVSDSRPSFSPHPSFSPRPVLEPQPTFSLPDRTQFSPPSASQFNPPYAQYIPGPLLPRFTQPLEPVKLSSRPMYPIYPAVGDDDIREIPPSYFNSRLGGPPQFGPPPIPPPMPSRPLPWLQDSLGGESLEKATELVREQMELDMDEDDFVRYEESHFPQDIKDLVKGIKHIKAATKADKDDKPSALKVTLMKHQQIGLTWMKAKEESSHKGGILADDMGLGKTIQAIALMTARPPTDPDRHPCLIVCPKALMDQWRREINRHIQPGKHQLSVFIFHDKQRVVPWRELKNYDVIITTFGTLTANYKLRLKAEKLEREGKDANIVKNAKEAAGLFTPSSKWHRVIVDEAQNIKNPSAKSTKACCLLNSTYRWCLTGTPMSNRLEDFQSLLGFLRIRPYNNKDKFKITFIRPIKSGVGSEQTMQQLRVLVKAVCLRRTKESEINGERILQLPPKTIEQVHAVFNEKESEMYEALNTKTQSQVTRLLDAGVLGRNYSHVLVLLLRLRQACCHPLLMQEYTTELPSNVQGVDLIANAKLLSATVVHRIKNNEDEDDGTCPICMDSVENAVIYIPCGHSVCSECFARISDPTVLARDDTSGLIKCQNCRGPVDPLRITDAESFKKAHDADSATASTAAALAEETEQSEQTDSDDYDSDTDTDGTGAKPKKKSLAELRKAAQVNKREKKRYLRRLEKTWIPSAKTEKAMEILQSIEDRGKNEKTIIFSQFTSLLDLLEVPIDRRGWKYVRFDGSMKISDRNSAVAAFTDDPEVKIMLVSLKAGNSGLNLVAASHVILFDPFWNPYVEDQAIDRAHRIGQMKEVFVHRLLIRNTVEDRIVELQEKKRELIGGALDEGGSLNVSRLDTRELAYLFGVQQ